MGPRGWLGVATLTSAVLGGHFGTASAATQAPESSILPNGVTVVTRQRADSHVVAIDLAVRAGARYEDEASPSAAHLLEHALLLGTERRPSRDQLLRTITSRGGRLMTTAGREALDVGVTVGRDDFEVGLDVVRDVVIASLFDEGVVDAERDVILQELDEREDDPETRATDLLFDTVFDRHPLGRPPSGTREGVSGLSVDRLRDFWRGRLVGSNVFVAVVSGFEHAAVVERLAASFGDLPIGTASSSDTRPLASRGPRTLEVVAGTDQSQILIGVPLPGVGTADRAALRVLAASLSGASGRLYAEIRDRRGLAYSTGAMVVQYADGGIMVVGAGTEAAQADMVIQLLLNELGRLRDDPLEPQELGNAIGGVIGGQALAEETSGAEAGSLVRATLFGLPSRNVQVEELRAVTADDVRRVARTYLDPSRLTVVVTRPSGKDAP